nr:hypothetical protein [Tanacetum cinerariifolium]
REGISSRNDKQDRVAREGPDTQRANGSSRLRHRRATAERHGILACHVAMVEHHIVSGVGERAVVPVGCVCAVEAVPAAVEKPVNEVGLTVTVGTVTVNGVVEVAVPPEVVTAMGPE